MSHMAQSRSACDRMDLDTLFIGVVVAIIVTVFALGVATGCGCIYWKHWTTGLARQSRHTPSDEEGRHLIKGKLFGHPKVPGKLFYTKEQLRRAVEAAQEIGTRPDTSRVVRKSL